MGNKKGEDSVGGHGCEEKWARGKLRGSDFRRLNLGKEQKKKCLKKMVYFH